MRPQLVTFLVCLLCVNFSAAQADLVVSWDLTGNDGAPTTQAPNATAMHITGLPITRGPGLTLNLLKNTVSAKGWDSLAASSPALDTDYFSFGFTVAQGYEVDLDSFHVLTRSTFLGPGMLGLFYSIDNFSTSLHTFDQSGGGEVSSPVNLSTLSSLTGTVEFRIIEIGNTSHDGTTATSANGVFRMANNNGSVGFEGTVLASVPEPSAFLFGGLISCVLGINYVRRRLCSSECAGTLCGIPARGTGR